MAECNRILRCYFTLGLFFTLTSKGSKAKLHGVHWYGKSSDVFRVLFLGQALKFVQIWVLNKALFNLSTTCYQIGPHRGTKDPRLNIFVIVKIL